MVRRRRLELRGFFFAALVAAWATLAVPAAAEEAHPFRASLFTGLGGAFDAEPSNDLDHSSFQLGFSWESDYDVLLGVRYGEIGWDDDAGLGARVGPDLSYLTVAGEYLFHEGYYTSGIYFGLGWYQLDEDADLEIPSDSAIGLALGLTGDFHLTDRVSIVVELSGHYTDLEDADLLAMGHAGVAYRF